MKRNAVVALGMFDGVHMGHRTILNRTSALAAEMEATPVAVSFRTHPQAVFGKKVPLLTLPDEREEIIRKMGLEPHLLAFDRNVANLSPREFIAMLAARYNIRGMVVGYNNRFGYQAQGDCDTLRAIGGEMGFRTEVVEAVTWQGEVVSSSRVREALQEGRLVEGNTMLTRPYFYRGHVEKHRQIGRAIGFPTLNIRPQEKLIACPGVYASRVKTGLALPEEGNALWGAVTNIGSNPTVTDEKDVFIESHVVEPLPEMYGEPIYVELLQFMREETRFSSVEQLQSQIAKDTAESVRILSKEKRR